MAQIRMQIIFEGHFVLIFEYSGSSLSLAQGSISWIFLILKYYYDRQTDDSDDVVMGTSVLKNNEQSITKQCQKDK